MKIPTPALDAWREELRKGQRTKYDFDALWKAACREATALEFPQIPELVKHCLADARWIIKAETRKRVPV